MESVSLGDTAGNTENQEVTEACANSTTAGIELVSFTPLGRQNGFCVHQQPIEEVDEKAALKLQLENDDNVEGEGGQGEEEGDTHDDDDDENTDDIVEDKILDKDTEALVTSV